MIRVWHKVIFWVEFNWFEFRVFLSLGLKSPTIYPWRENSCIHSFSKGISVMWNPKSCLGFELWSLCPFPMTITITLWVLPGFVLHNVDCGEIRIEKLFSTNFSRSKVLLALKISIQNIILWLSLNISYWEQHNSSTKQVYHKGLYSCIKKSV